MHFKMVFLTFKQELFCREYVKSRGNATRAVAEAYDHIKTDNARAVTGHRLLKKANIRERIREIFDSSELSIKNSIQYLKQGLEAKRSLLVNGKIVLVDDNKTRLETITLCYRLYGLDV